MNNIFHQDNFFEIKKAFSLLLLRKINFAPNSVRRHIKIGLFLLIMFALSSDLFFFKTLIKFDPRFIGSDSVTLLEKRFKRLKKVLTHWGVVGYISDGDPLMNFDASLEYILLQRSLAPIILDNNLNHPLIVGNFHGYYFDRNILKNNSLILYKDFGQGIKLFIRKIK